jgi:hypothetical protein
MTLVRSITNWFVVVILVLALIVQRIDSFTPCPARSTALQPHYHHQRQQQKQQRLRHSKLFFGNILGGLFGGGHGSRPLTNSNEDADDVETLRSSSVMELSATRIKVAPLKFFLQIYLVAEQNKPVKGSWVLRNNDEKNALEMYYKDGTAMFSIGLDDTKIRIDRHGSRPSLQYMLQESVMVHGILDELNGIAFDVEDIAPEKRLIQFVENDAIEKARGTLPARKEG